MRMRRDLSQAVPLGDQSMPHLRTSIWNRAKTGPWGNVMRRKAYLESMETSEGFERESLRLHTAVMLHDSVLEFRYASAPKFAGGRWAI